ncbi:MAG: DUF86 domain-containing protein [Bacilli bacterium]|nr:DUF86 domain-containing protein [Bacilli bacterium]
MDDLLLSRIDSLLEHIDLIINDLDGKSLEDFKQSSLLARATCFSLTQIGEQMISLEKSLKNDYKDLPWKYARDMRNIIVHVYNKVNYKIVYDTAIRDLPILKKSFEDIRDKFLNEA